MIIRKSPAELEKMRAAFFLPEKARGILERRGPKSRAGQRLLKWLKEHKEVMKTGVKGPFSFVPLMQSDPSAVKKTIIILKSIIKVA